VSYESSVDKSDRRLIAQVSKIKKNKKNKKKYKEAENTSLKREQ
jgi:hypothetical protein